jgi:hypothetical protein
VHWDEIWHELAEIQFDGNTFLREGAAKAGLN